MKNYLLLLFAFLSLFSCNKNLLQDQLDDLIPEGEKIQIWDTIYTIDSTTVLMATVFDEQAGYNTIPPEIGQLIHLEEIIVTNKGFIGEIPAEIGNLTKLKRLRLYGNAFSGELPPELFTLDSLYALEINDNQFSGEISSAIGDLTNLQFVKLENNQFSGIIPESICELDLYSSFGLDTTFFNSYYAGFRNNNFCPDSETEEYPACIGSSTLGTQNTDNCP